MVLRRQLPRQKLIGRFEKPICPPAAARCKVDKNDDRQKSESPGAVVSPHRPLADGIRWTNDDSARVQRPRQALADRNARCKYCSGDGGTREGKKHEESDSEHC